MVSHFSFSGRIWGEVPCSRAECCNWQTWLKLDHRVVQNSDWKKMALFQFFWVLKYPQEIVCLSFLFFFQSAALSFSLSVAVCLSLCLSICRSIVYLMLCLSVTLYSMFVCLHDALSLYMSLYLYVALSKCWIYFHILSGNYLWTQMYWIQM